MNELLEYFKTAMLPTFPLKINGYATVTGPGFIESCRIRYANGSEQGLQFLTEYKAAIEVLNQPDAASASVLERDQLHAFSPSEHDLDFLPLPSVRISQHQ